MKMHQINYFLALCEEKSFTRAAKRCGIKQPSLTRAIQELEHELGGRLFERSVADTRMTDLGYLVQPDFAQIDRSVANARRKVAKFTATFAVNVNLNPNNGDIQCAQ